LAPRSRSLLQALGGLKELRLQSAEIGNNDLPSGLLDQSSKSPFPSLRLIDLGENKVTPETIEAAFGKREFNFCTATDDPQEGSVAVIIGKKEIREIWEITTEWRSGAAVSVARTQGLQGQSTPTEWSFLKESWEIDAEQGLLTEGGRRRSRIAAAAAAKVTARMEAWRAGSAGQWDQQVAPRTRLLPLDVFLW
jgi:hypothetical protein